MFRLMMDAHPDLVEVGENRYLVDGLKDPGANDANLSYDTQWLKNERVFRMRGLSIPDDLDGRALMDDLVMQLRKGHTNGPTVLTFHSDIAVLDRLFPNARYLHIYRDPRDVANSCTRFGWSGNVYYGSDFWLASEASWAAFRPNLDPARYAEVRYEDLVTDAEAELRRLCDFLGLPFSDTMLKYATNSTYEKPDPNLVNQWKRKLTPTQIALVERRCGSLMAALGYERAAPDVQPLSAPARVFWAVDNKLRKVFKAISFYGLRDYGLEKIFRLPGFSTQHQSVLHSMQATMNRSLK